VVSRFLLTIRIPIRGGVILPGHNVRVLRPIESSNGFVISDLPYFKGGMDFLPPDGEISTYWDHLETSCRSWSRRAWSVASG